ncbi:MAG: ABC transporter permease subunit [Clostridiales bacterium]|nr:ABC transporter permease subunit [Clostridiales bacterium]
MKKRKFSATQLFLALFFLVTVILPVLTMFSNLVSADIGKIITDKQFGIAALHSLKVSATATLISITLAFLLAWCMTRTNIKGKGLFGAIILLPMLIPSISHGMGLIILFGQNGQLTNLFGLNSSIYGFWGIVIGSVMYSLPVAYLMISDILRYEDSTPYEAASVLGVPKINRLCSITFPYIRKPMISVLFATFTLIITDYGVPVMVGGKYNTLPLMMYNEVIGRLNFANGSVIGMVLLVPAVIAFIFDFISRDTHSASFVPKPFALKKSIVRDALSYFILIITSITLIYPIITFAGLAFNTKYPSDLSFTLKHVLNTMEKGAGHYLINSIIIAFAVSILGVCIAFACAYFTARIGGLSAKLLHLMSILSLAIPGLVLGLSYVLFFKKSFMADTLIILIVVNTIHFFASPYLMIYNSLGKLNANLEDVGLTLGIRRLHIIKDVIIPQSKLTLIEMFTYFFVNSMITISAVSFLAVTLTKPLSLLITQFQHLMLLEASAFVSILILAVNLIIKGLALILRHIILRKENTYYVNKKTV